MNLDDLIYLKFEIPKFPNFKSLPRKAQGSCLWQGGRAGGHCLLFFENLSHKTEKTREDDQCSLLLHSCSDSLAKHNTLEQWRDQGSNKRDFGFGGGWEAGTSRCCALREFRCCELQKPSWLHSVDHGYKQRAS